MRINESDVYAMLRVLGVSPELANDKELSQKLTDSLNHSLGADASPTVPRPDESLAVSVWKPKTVALAFDRVYRFPAMPDPPPKEIGFFCSTDSEIFSFCLLKLVPVLMAANVPSDIEKYMLAAGASTDKSKRQRENIRGTCTEFQTKYGLCPTFFYDTVDKYDDEFKAGKEVVLTTSISNIAMVDEKQLSWEQILEFRRDIEAKAKYRRFVRWIDMELQTKSRREVEDLVTIRLDDYQWALKKHGLKTSLGTLSSVLDPKFLASVSATMAATSLATDSLWGALAGVSLVMGRVVLNFGTGTIDKLEETRKNNYEVAYIYDVQKRFGQ